MKKYFTVQVECNENGRWVGVGEFSGVAETIEEAIQRAVTIAQKEGLKSETGHRAVSASCIGSVQFGLKGK